MPAKPLKKISCTFLLWLGFLTTHAQSASCPVNLDFETGNFANWQCRTGQVIDQAGQNTVLWTSTGSPVQGRQEIIPASNTQADPYGLFPQHCPNGSRYSVKLGNDQGGHEAEGISYTYQIPSNDTNFSILYYYAVVLQAPNHTASQQPRFRAKVIDLADGSEISCVSFDFTASGSLPGFVPSSQSSLVLYKDWTPISVDLSKYAGRTIQIEFITSDCTFQQHFGYAYIDVGSRCNGTIAGSTYCQGDSAIEVTAPYGFQNYQWYSNNNFTQVLSTAQTLQLDPGNSIGSTFPVIVTPYAGFGCLDTLYATITSGQKPVSNAGADKVICNKVPVQLGVVANSEYSYSWSPAEFLDDPAASAPYTVPTLLAPIDLTVKTTDISTGCFSYDTVKITPIIVDTSSSILGNEAYCPGEKIKTFLTVTNPSTQVQWYQNNTPIIGSTNLTYNPLAFGTYWARIFQNGCYDSTRMYVIVSSPVPKAAISVDKEVQCLDKPIHFTSTSAIVDNEPMTYAWKFSDGSSSQGTDVIKSFPSVGQYTASLLVTSANSCVDSTRRTVAVSTFCTPLVPTAFTPNSDGKNDLLKPYLVGVKTMRRFVIYNRYGNIVFSSSHEGEGWDGTYNGKPLATDVFVWLLEYVGDDNVNVLQKGTVTLIR